MSKPVPSSAPAVKPEPPKAPTPPTASNPTPADTPDGNNNCKGKLYTKIAIISAVALAVLIPICKTCCKEDEEEDGEGDVKYVGSAVLDKLVAWVKEVKGEGAEDGHYRELMNVPEFAKTQSL